MPKGTKEKKVMVAFQIPESLQNELEAASFKMDLSKSTIVRQALKDILEEYKGTGSIKIK